RNVSTNVIHQKKLRLREGTSLVQDHRALTELEFEAPLA
ncbi:TSPAN16 isoform 5, partial [Pongo abelii]